ncbi:MAG: hypothetical protein J6A08_02590 [Lachnospiraceae bacterium]|nr:hypothetical protein [Lachnospiraceae bacterium]
MKCPLCDTEMVISGSGYVTRGGKFYRKVSLACRNRKCGNYEKTVKVDYMPLSVAEESDSQEENDSEVKQGESGE